MIIIITIIIINIIIVDIAIIIITIIRYLYFDIMFCIIPGWVVMTEPGAKEHLIFKNVKNIVINIYSMLINKIVKYKWD